MTVRVLLTFRCLDHTTGVLCFSNAAFTVAQELMHGQKRKAQQRQPPSMQDMLLERVQSTEYFKEAEAGRGTGLSVPGAQASRSPQ